MYLQFINDSFIQYEELPQRIRLADGSTRTSLHELSIQDLEGLGVYRYEDTTPAFDSYTHQRTGEAIFNHEDRTFEYAISPIDPNILKTTLISTVQRYLDSEAQSHYYDGILSLCSYATSENIKFGAEGRAAVIWRDACWDKGYEILNACEAGTMEIPTPDELISEMPSMVWPE